MYFMMLTTAELVTLKQLIPTIKQYISWDKEETGHACIANYLFMPECFGRIYSKIRQIRQHRR